DPETAHALALNALKLAPLRRPAADDEKLRVEAFGLTFPNPLGLAAGFDKHAEVIDPLLRLGFGFVEAGGVTPRPQPGNPLARVIEARERAAIGTKPKPLLLKIAPDLTLADLDDVVGIARRHRIDGMIVGNTTLTRPDLRDRMGSIEQGGLSGRPLFPLSTRMLAETYVRTEGAFPLIGVGGIDSGAAA